MTSDVVAALLSVAGVGLASTGAALVGGVPVGLLTLGALLLLIAFVVGYREEPGPTDGP